MEVVSGLLVVQCANTLHAQFERVHPAIGLPEEVRGHRLNLISPSLPQESSGSGIRKAWGPIGVAQHIIAVLPSSFIHAGSLEAIVHDQFGFVIHRLCGTHDHNAVIKEAKTAENLCAPALGLADHGGRITQGKL